MSTRQQREKIVLGTMTLFPDWIPQIREKIGVDDFSSTGRKKYYECILESYDAHGTTDVVDVTDRADEKGIIDEHLDPVAPVDFEKNVVGPSETMAMHVPELIRESTGQKLQQELSVLQTDRGEKPSDQIEELEDVVEDARKSLSHSSDVVTVEDKKEEVMEQIEKAANGEVSGISTGIRSLDEKIGGINPGDYIVVAGRPSMGKTSLSRNICTRSARDGHKSLFVSCEMTKAELVKQFYCSWCDVPPWRASEGDLADKQLNKLRGYDGPETSQIDIIMPDTNDITEIVATVEGNHQREEYDFVVFDHMQLLSADVDGNRTQEMTKISRRLALLANRLNLGVIALSQLNRSVMDRNPPKPKLADLRETGAIEQDADKVLMIYRDYYYSGNDDMKGVAEINIAKHRGGPTANVEVEWDGDMMRFGDLVPEPKGIAS